MIVDCAVYDDGVRRPGTLALEDAQEAADRVGSFSWIGLHEPTLEDFEAVRDEFHLHELVIEDAVKAHQRPKIDRYPNLVFVVLKEAIYTEPDEVSFAELQLIMGDRFLISVSHGDTGLFGDVRRFLEQNPDVLTHGPASVFYAVADRVVDDYGPVIDELEGDVQEVEVEVFSDQRTNPAERIYGLKRQVLDWLRNSVPMVEVLATPAEPGNPWCPDELATYLRDVADHLQRVIARAEMTRDLLTDALDANLAQVGVRQNDDMRTISAWAAIIAAPTLLAGVWGMNFTHMPELDWWVGYPLALVLMVGVSVWLYARFKRVGWL